MTETNVIKFARTFSQIGSSLQKGTATRNSVIKLLGRLNKEELTLVAAVYPDLAGVDLPRTKESLQALLATQLMKQMAVIDVVDAERNAMSLKGNYGADRRPFDAAAKEMKPLFADLKRDIKYIRDVPPKKILTSKVKRNITAQINEYQPLFKKQFKQIIGPDISDADVQEVMSTALNEFWGRAEYALDRKTDLMPLMVSNLQADGVWRRAGPMLAWQSPGGGELVLNVSNSTDKAAGLGIMVALFLLELIAMIASLLGIALPKVPAGSVADDVGREMAKPRMQRILKRLLRILNDARKTLTEKIDAVLDFAKAIFEVGLLGTVLKKIFDGLSRWRIAILVALFVAQLIIMFTPGAGQALVAKKLATVALGVTSLGAKAWEIGDILEA